MGKGLSGITKKVIEDLGKLTDQQFMNRYSIALNNFTGGISSAIEARKKN